MKKIAILFLCVATSVCSQEWSVDAGFDLILQPPITTQTGEDVFLTYDSITGQILATWGDTLNSNHPTYSFYNGTSWSSNAGLAPLTISGTSKVSSDLISAFNPTTGQFLATWSDLNNSNYPTYSIYTPGSSWSSFSTISNSATAGDSRIYCIYNPVSNTFIAAWEDSNTGEPYYSIYSSGIWSSPASISTTVPSTADVYLSCNPNTGDVLATWRTSANVATYSIYNGATWSSASTIAVTPTVQQSILSCFDISSGQFMAVWADRSTPNNPYYSFYTLSGWTTPAPISTTSEADTNVTISQNSLTGDILAIWLDELSANQSPAYSIYNGTSWSTTSFIAAAATSNANDCYSCYDSLRGQFFAAWGNIISSPTYSIYGSSAVPPPSQPASFSGVQKKNRFGVVQEYYNSFSWEGNPSVTSYQLFRNNQLIAQLNGASTSYEDHDQPRSNQLYSLVAVNAYGNSSAALVIVGAK